MLQVLAYFVMRMGDTVWHYLCLLGFAAAVLVPWVSLRDVVPPTMTAFLVQRSCLVQRTPGSSQHPSELRTDLPNVLLGDCNRLCARWLQEDCLGGRRDVCVLGMPLAAN